MASDLDLRLHFGFFNAMLDDNHHPDRVYNAEDMSKFFDGLITEGVYEHVGAKFHTTPSGDGTKIVIGSGRAWKNHIYVYTDEAIEEPILAANSVYDRYDTLCFRFSQATRKVALEWVSGPIRVGGVASKPTISGAELMPLCCVLRHSGKATVDAGDIEYLVGVNNATPFVKNAIGQLNYTWYYENWDNVFHTWHNGNVNTWNNWWQAVNTQWQQWLTNNNSTVKTDWANWLTNSNSTVKTQWGAWLTNNDSTVKTDWGNWLTNSNSTVKTQWNNWFGTSDSTGIKGTFWTWFGTSDSAGIKKTFWDWFGVNSSSGVKKTFYDWFGRSDSEGIRSDYLTWKNARDSDITNAINNYHVSVEQTFWDWFGSSDSAGIRKTFYDWFGRSNGSGIRKTFYDWFGTSDTASGSVKKAWKDWFDAAKDAYGEVAHYETHIYVGNNNSTKQNDNVSYGPTVGLKIFDSNNFRHNVKIEAEGNLKVRTLADGNLYLGAYDSIESLVVSDDDISSQYYFMTCAKFLLRGTDRNLNSDATLGTLNIYGRNLAKVTRISNESIEIKAGPSYFKKTQTVSTSAATTFTLSNSEITASSIVDVYTDSYGVNPSSVTVSNGKCVVVIPKQSSAFSLTVMIAVANPEITSV